MIATDQRTDALIQSHTAFLPWPDRSGNTTVVGNELVASYSAGMGIVLIASISAVIYKQIPDLPAIIGMVFIVLEVVIINVFSNSSAH